MFTSGFIDPRFTSDINNTGRVHFLSQDHSSDMTSFLETNDEQEKDFTIDQNEKKYFEDLFRNIFEEMSNKTFPIEPIHILISSMESRYIICYLLYIEKRLIIKLNEDLPFLNNEQKSYIFKIFKILMKYFKDTTEYLIENNLLTNICNVLIDETVLDINKIAPIECIHYYASRGKDNAAKIFNKISVEHDGITERTAPIDCMIKLISIQNQQNDDVLKDIRKSNGFTLLGDDATMQLRLLIMKFFNAILTFDNFPYGKGKEIVDHIIDCTFTYSERSIEFLDCAIYGCSLAANNNNLEKNFSNAMQTKGGIINFINILDSDKNLDSIRINILLCFKSLVEKNLIDPKKLLNINIIEHLIPHIKNDKKYVLCENAIQTLSSFLIAEPNEYTQCIIKTDIPSILFNHLSMSNYYVKVASLSCWCEILKNTTVVQIQMFITSFPQILEVSCSLMLSEVSDDVFQLIFEMAKLLVNAYIVGGRKDEMKSIIFNNDIPSMIDSFLESSSSSFQFSIAEELKRLILCDEGNSNE